MVRAGARKSTGKACKDGHASIKGFGLGLRLAYSMGPQATMGNIEGLREIL